MLATVNPCGFAMLPAYLSYFLGIESGRRPPATTAPAARVAPGRGREPRRVARLPDRVHRHRRASCDAGGDVLIDWAKYVTHPDRARPSPASAWPCCSATTCRSPRPGSTRAAATARSSSMFVFGVSYAIASIGCTLPLFIGAALTSFTSQGAVSGVLLVLAYGAGMALVLTALTVTLALARGGLLAGAAPGAAVRRPGRRRVPGAGRPVPRLLLDLQPALRRHRLHRPAAALASTVEGWSFDAQAWLQDRGGWVLGHRCWPSPSPSPPPS